MQRRRIFDKNVPPLQKFVQGQMSTRGMLLTQAVQQQRFIQPGNTFNRKLRTFRPDVIS